MFRRLQRRMRDSSLVHLLDQRPPNLGSKGVNSRNTYATRRESLVLTSSRSGSQISDLRYGWIVEMRGLHPERLISESRRSPIPNSRTARSQSPRRDTTENDPGISTHDWPRSKPRCKYAPGPYNNPQSNRENGSSLRISPIQRNTHLSRILSHGTIPLR